MNRTIMLSSAAVLALAAAAGAQVGEFLYATNSSGEFHTIDTANASTNEIRTGTGWQGLAYNPNTDELYAYNGSQISVRDRNTGIDSPLFNENTGADTGLALGRPGFDRFYSTNGGTIFEFDFAGNQTNAWNAGINSVLDLAANSAGEIYYADGFNNGDVYRIDPNNGQSTLVYNAGTGGNGGFTAIAFGRDGFLYGVTISSDRLLRLDLNNNAFTDIGGVPYGDVRSMTGLVPTPGAAAVLGLGGLLAARRRR